MSRRLFSSLLLLLSLALSPFGVAQEGPRLKLTEPLKDFGSVPKGRMLDWSFEVLNTGTTDLEILAAKPTCGCTVADFDKVIKPGKSGKVTAHVDTTSFS